MHFGNHAGLFMVLLPTLALGLARDPNALRDDALAIARWAHSAPRPAWLETSEDPRMKAAGVAAETLGRQEGLGHQPAASPGQEGASGTPAADDLRITVLASTALGDGALHDLFALAAQSPGTRVVFRGVQPGQSLMDFLRTLSAHLSDLDPPPAVELDPTPFAGEDIAPILIASGPQGEVARVAGLADPQWLRAQIAAGQRGDLGIRGPVRPIGEPNLVDELKRRLANLDLVKLRERAVGRYWQRLNFETLGVAGQRRERTFDPTIAADADLRDHEDRLIVAAGTKTNPLDVLPFTQRLVVFDASDARQVATAKDLGAAAAPGQRVTYIATGFERRSGWEGLKSVEERLAAPVYLLTPDVRRRFALERVPAVVEARGRVFVITEVPPQ